MGEGHGRTSGAAAPPARRAGREDPRTFVREYDNVRAKVEHREPPVEVQKDLQRQNGGDRVAVAPGSTRHGFKPTRIQTTWHPPQRP